jgi:hypothetical protein
MVVTCTPGTGLFFDCRASCVDVEAGKTNSVGTFSPNVRVTLAILRRLASGTFVTNVGVRGVTGREAWRSRGRRKEMR